MKVIILFFMLLNISPVNATVNDSNLWVNTNFTGKVRDRYLVYGEFQPRFISDMSDLGVYMYRAAIGYQISEPFSLWAGYAYMDFKRPVEFDENRPFLQSTHNYSYDQFTLINRTRLEFRHLQGREETSTRLRHLVRSLYQFNQSKKLFLVLYDELFYNLNTIENSKAPNPREGIDQNRAFIGMGHRFGEKSNHFFELGYMNNYIVRYLKDNLVNHVLAAQYIYNFKI
jgi:hypothetical protein